MKTISAAPEEQEIMRTPSGDTDLLSSISHSDRSAFTTLYDRHSRAVFLYCLAIVRASTDAEEAAQDVWMALWNGRKRIHIATSSALPWLFVTAKHKSVDMVRSLQKRQSVHLDDLVSISGTADTELAVEASELERFVTTTINSMPDKDRSIYELCIVKGMSYKAAAAELALQEGAVRNRVHRVRAHLRAQISAFGGSDENS